MAARGNTVSFYGAAAYKGAARILRREHALICAGTKAQTDAQRPGVLPQ